MVSFLLFLCVRILFRLHRKVPSLLVCCLYCFYNEISWRGPNPYIIGRVVVLEYISSCCHDNIIHELTMPYFMQKETLKGGSIHMMLVGTSHGRNTLITYGVLKLSCLRMITQSCRQLSSYFFIPTSWTDKQAMQHDFIKP